MDILELDPSVLDTTAVIIEGYCAKQTSIMDDYLSNTNSLSSDWTDDQTLGPLLEEIKRMRNSVVSIMEEIRRTYPQYFREKAEHIRQRPKF